MEMDLASLHILGNILSSVAQMCAILIVIYCAMSFFSWKPVKSLKPVFISLSYFFSLATILFAFAQFLLVTSGILSVLSGIPSLMAGSLLHLCFGVFILILYWRLIWSEIRGRIS